MMPMEKPKEQITLIVTPYESGFNNDGTKLRVSLMIKPKLTPIPNGVGRLGEFELFRNWPKVVKRPNDSVDEPLKFNIVFNNGHSSRPVIPENVDLVDPKLWSCYFNNDTPVRKADVEEAFESGFRSYPVSEISSYIDGLYRNISTKILKEEKPTKDFYGFAEKPAVDDHHTIDATNGQPCRITLQGAVQNQSTILTYVITRKPWPGDFEGPYDADGKTATYIYTPKFPEGEGGGGFAFLEFQAKTDFNTLSNVGTININVASENEAVDRLGHVETAGPIPKASVITAEAPPNLTDIVINQNNRKILEEKANIHLQNKLLPPDLLEREGITIKDKFYYLTSYYELFMTKKQSSSEPTPNSDKAHEKMEFHEKIEWLNDHEVIMRRLGMILDLDFEIPFTSIPETGTMKIQVSNMAITPSTCSCETKYRKEGSGQNPLLVIGSDETVAVSDASMEHVEKGMLVLDNNYAIVTKDVAGSAMKLMGLSNSLSNTSEEGDREYKINTIDSAGFSLVEINRASRLKTHMSYIADRNKKFLQMLFGSMQSTTPPLTTRELIKGYRIDVKFRNKWHSLCFRKGVYQAKSGKHDDSGKIIRIEEIDEGYTSITTTLPVSSSANPAAPPLPYLSESHFQWTGWGLCVPQVGYTIGEDNEPVDPKVNKPVDRRDPESRSKEEESDLEIAFYPITDQENKDKKFPKLRFGESYQFRARAVDIAGNSLAFNELIDEKYSFPDKGLRYLRYEPIAPPLVIAHVPIDAKTQPGEAEDTLVIRSDYDRTMLQYSRATAVDYPLVSERFVAPPRVFLQMAEAHGKFDNLKWYTKDYDASTIDGANDYEKAYNTLVKKDKTDCRKPYVYEGEKGRNDNTRTLKLNYLPDPLARGALFQGPFGKISQDFKGAWPGIYSILLRLEEKDQDGEPDATSSSPEPSPNHGICEIKIDKAEVMEIDVCCSIADNGKGIMALNDLVQNDSAADLITSFDKFTDEGKNWMLTPSRKIHLIHAVQRPLLPPVITIKKTGEDQLNEISEPKIGQTTIDITGKIEISAKSTSKVEVISKIERLVEDEKDGFTRVLVLGPVMEISVLNHEQNSVSIPATEQQLNDTKYKKVIYSAIATSRFQKYFTSPDDPTKKLDFTRSSDHVITIEVKNTGIPSMPEIVKSIPVFRWEEVPNQNYLKRHSGLRVYVKGPWFSSGDGEMLGIILKNSPNQKEIDDANDDNDVSSYVTRWGQDIIHASNSLPNPFPYKEQFRNYKSCLEKVTLNELDHQDSKTVTVVGYEASYDKNEKLWYGDVEIDAHPAYFPFVTLSSVRYQPNSIQTAHISRVAFTPPMQIAPSRSVSLIRLGERKIRITVYGDMYISNSSHNTQISLEGLIKDSKGLYLTLTALTTPEQIGPLPVTHEFELPVDPSPFEGFRFQIAEHEIHKTDPANPLQVVNRLVFLGEVYLL